MYKIEHGKPFYYSLMMLRYTYTIPANIEKSTLRIFWIKYILLTIFSVTVVGVLPIAHFIMAVKDNTGVDVSEDFTFSVGDTGCILICVLFTSQYKGWSEFFADIIIMRKSEASTKLKNFVRKSNRYSILYICYMLSGVVLYSSISLSRSPDCKKFNEENGLHEACLVFFSIWLPFDANDVFSAIMVVAVQTIVVLHVIPATGMICFVILESAEMLIVHIDILNEELINLFEGTTKQEIHDKLRNCINYHNYILRLGKRYNDLAQNAVGLTSVISTIVLGCMLNQLLGSKPIGALVYMIGYVVGLFSICQAGQRIMDQSTTIGDAVYASNWHRADSKTKKDLALVILRSQTPVYLHASPLGVYNYALFAMMLKTSYSYMTLLQQST